MSVNSFTKNISQIWSQKMSEMQSLIWSRSCEEFINLMEEVEREEWFKSLRSLPFLFDFHLRTLSSSLELSFSTLALPKCSRVAMKHKSLSFPSAELDKIRKLALQCRPGRILKILKSQTILCWEFYKQHPNTCLINYVANVLIFLGYIILSIHQIYLKRPFV